MKRIGLFFKIPDELDLKIEKYAETHGKKKYHLISELIDIGMKNIGD